MTRITRLAAVAALAGVTILGGATIASADSGAAGTAIGSPGVLSGNVIEIPVNVPIDLCGDSVNVIGLIDPVLGSACVNG